MMISMSTLIVLAADATAKTDNSSVRTALISAFTAIVVALGGQWLLQKGKSKPDVTEIGRSGLEIVPEMGDKVLEALSRVQSLTDAVATARVEVAEARMEAAAMRAELTSVRLELAGAKAEAIELRAENAALRARNAAA